MKKFRAPTDSLKEVAIIFFALLLIAPAGGKSGTGSAALTPSRSGQQ